MIDGLMAQCTVTDLERAEDWYARLLGRGPDARPMAGLLEWHLGDAYGLQVWRESERAGQSSVVLTETALDEAAAHASHVGIDHDGPRPGGGARILQLVDPDGNRVVMTGP
ncbi:VOC family protein [Nocardioides aquaticus]|jgi:catechol 2,3-dioxygenase-like lactoylglutathione lyase family enzyme|uniref:VOC family protein n=1 Tax=Nocardioides aquaticus TaxID=160826 RepID=UPI0031D86D43